jgi:uncharacterized membrane protein
MGTIVSLHPMVVHFPIALLSLYAILEFLTLHPRFQKNTTLYYIKFFLLVCGVLGSMVASVTGENVEHQIGKTILIERHSFFAGLSQNTFIILLLVYLVKLCVQEQVHPLIARIPQRIM